MSDCFKIYDKNLVDQATLGASSSNALFPVSNVKDSRRSKVYRSNSNNDSVVFDFQETSEINSLFIVPDKRSGFGLSTVVVEFNAVDSWASPAHSVTLPFSTELGIGHVTFNMIEYRFARVVMTSTLGYCELANIFIGKSIDLSKGINFGWSLKDEELSNKQYNRYGQLFTDVILRQKKINCTLENLPKEDMDKMFSLLDRTGETNPIFIAIGNNEMISDYRRFSGMVYLNDVPTVVNSLFAKFSLTLSLKEAT